jgi:hypothetical protein
VQSPEFKLRVGTKQMINKYILKFGGGTKKTLVSRKKINRHVIELMKNICNFKSDNVLITRIYRRIL